MKRALARCRDAPTEETPTSGFAELGVGREMIVSAAAVDPVLEFPDAEGSEEQFLRPQEAAGRGSFDHFVSRIFRTRYGGLG